MIFYNKTVVVIFISFFLFGCASKEVYKPDNVDGVVFYDSLMSSFISSSKRDGAKLNNGVILTKLGRSTFKIDNNFEFVDLDNKHIITANNEGIVKIYNYNGNVTNELNVSIRPLSIAIKDNFMYGVNIDNEVFIFDIQTKSFVYKKRYQTTLTIDEKIAKPVISKELIAIATLDGRVSVFDSNTNNLIRNITIDGSTNFANITFMHIYDNILFCATKNKVVHLSAKNIIQKNYLLKDILYLDGFLYLFTVEGDIIKLDKQLNEVASKKLKFARFSVAKTRNNKIYLIERTGYVIVLNKNLDIKKIDEIAIDNEKVLILDDMLYFGDKYKRLNL